MKKKDLDFSRIKLLAMDVDGVLTDGGMFFSEDGEQVKRFNALDGFGIKTLIEQGIKVALISFNLTNAIKYRTNALGIHKVMTGVHDKAKALRQVAEEFKISLDNTVYIGDDMLDLPALRLAGIAVTVPNSADEIKFEADLVTRKAGGCGAVREVCDLIRKSQTDKLKTLGVIPARYESKRFPGKPLADILGMPLIVRVYKQAKTSMLDNVIIATDDQRILQTCLEHNCKAVLTNETHQTGTDRVWEVASQTDADIIVNIQGDEPMIEGELINQLLDQFSPNPALDMATAMYKVPNQQNLDDKNIVKVITDKNHFALYFSRAPLINNENGYNKHLGIYAYNRLALQKFSSNTRPDIEEAEHLEQLRALYNGFAIKVVEYETDSVSVNLPEDIAKVEAILKR